jgi:hypothetical protein
MDSGIGKTHPDTPFEGAGREDGEERRRRIIAG